MNKKGRRRKEPFLGIPMRVARSEAFTTLPPQSLKILIHLLSQYNGHNNGSLKATDNTLRGWNMSGGALTKWRNELERSGLVVLTQKGKRPNIASQYGITWNPIDEGSHGYQGTMTKALNYWERGINPEFEKRIRQKKAPVVQGAKRKYERPTLQIIEGGRRAS